jgi:hypothetical protein
MIRRFLVGSMVAAAALAVALPSGAGAASGCVLAGNAKFGSPLTITPKASTYTFSGTLKNCTAGGVPKSATVTASGSGSLSCRGSKGTGSATIRWVNGASTTLKFTISGQANAVTVASTSVSGYLAGQKIKAEIAFTGTTPTPDKCATTGITGAAFNGVAHVGV